MSTTHFSTLSLPMLPETSCFGCGQFVKLCIAALCKFIITAVENSFCSSWECLLLCYLNRTKIMLHLESFFSVEFFIYVLVIDCQ